MRKLIFVSVLSATVVVCAGCGGGNEVNNDVLIVIPDYGSVDTQTDVVSPEDQGNTERDAAPQDTGADAVDPADALEDQGGTDTTVTTDDGMDMVEDVGPRCSLGSEACNSASADRKTCDTASVMGRITLATDNAINLTTNTLGVIQQDDPPTNHNDDELDDDDCPWFPDEGDPLWCQPECADAGLDHFFRVYLVRGDYFSVSVSDYLVYQETGTNIDFMLKVYRGNQCPLGREMLVSCINDKSSGSNNTEVLQIKPLTEEEAGWYTIALDSVDEENAGTYTLQARLFQNSEYTGEWDLCCDYPLD